MHFELSSFYKRDTTFDYDIGKNSLDVSTLRKGERIADENTLLYEVDKIDSYLKDYDVLPATFAPLVSLKFKNLFSHLLKEIQFVPTLIGDSSGSQDDSFFVLNILTSIPCMDKERSIYEIKQYGKSSIMKIKELYIIDGSLNGHSIVRMEEHKSYIIITEDFKNLCEQSNLKGFNFIEEGHSIYK